MYKKISAFKYLLIFVFIKSTLMAQKPDSLAFKLKPFFVGVEFGRSPKINFINSDNAISGYPSFTQKYLPCFAFNFGYNFRVHKNGFLTAKIGYALLQYDYTNKDGNINYSASQQTVGTQTNYIQNRVSELSVENVKIVSNNALLILDYQKYYSPFKNNKIKLFVNGGTFVKFVVNTKADYATTFTKDSTFSSNGMNTKINTYTNLKNQSSNYGFTNVGGLNYYLSAGSGLLFNNKSVQHKIGLLLNIRLGDSYDSYLIRRTNFLNLNVFYSINF